MLRTASPSSGTVTTIGTTPSGTDASGVVPDHFSGNACQLLSILEYLAFCCAGHLTYIGRFYPNCIRDLRSNSVVRIPWVQGFGLLHFVYVHPLIQTYQFPYLVNLNTKVSIYR